MRGIGWVLCAFFIAMLGTVPAAFAQKRVALVIGNSACCA